MVRQGFALRRAVKLTNSSKQESSASRKLSPTALTEVDGKILRHNGPEPLQVQDDNAADRMVFSRKRRAEEYFGNSKRRRKQSQPSPRVLALTPPNAGDVC